MTLSAIALVAGFCAHVAAREVATLASKGGGVDALAVEGPRPVATAIQRLIQTYGYRISYEDPRYVYAEDLEDVTAKYSRVAEPAAGKAPAARLLVPKGGKFTVDVQPSKGAEAVLKQTILASAAASPGQRFQVRKDDGMYHVVPTGARDRNGNPAPHTSVLDSAISLPMKERTAYETIVALCGAISAASGVKVEVGMTGFESHGGDPASEPKYPLGAEAEPARAVLKRALDEFGKTREQLTWMLLFGNQTTDNAYALNLFRVRGASKAKPAASDPDSDSSPFDAARGKR
jgi:hypothetical protein